MVGHQNLPMAEHPDLSHHAQVRLLAWIYLKKKRFAKQ